MSYKEVISCAGNNYRDTSRFIYTVNGSLQPEEAIVGVLCYVFSKDAVIWSTAKSPTPVFWVVCIASLHFFKYSGFQFFQIGIEGAKLSV